MSLKKYGFKKFRIFHDKEAEDFKYVLFGINEEDYLVHISATYNQILREDLLLVDWLKDKGIDYLKLNFEEFLQAKKDPKVPDESADASTLKFYERLNAATKLIEEKRFKTAFEYCSKNKDIELKEDFLYDKQLGLFIKQEYGTYESKQFIKELGALVTFSLQDIDDLAIVKKEYESFKDYWFENQAIFTDKLHEQYKTYKEDVYADASEADSLAACPPLKHKRDVLNLISYNWFEFVKNQEGTIDITLAGDTTWDEEHGFRFEILKNGGLQVH